MRDTAIFGLALGLAGTPWEVNEVSLDLEAKRLDIRLDFPPGTRFPRPSDGKLSSVYDTKERTWRHLNFFQYECHLHAWVPRVDGGEPDGIKQVEVPWARPGSGFTLLMEALMVILARTGMTVAEVGRVLVETAHRIWRVLFHHVGRALGHRDLSRVRELTVDETSVRRGHEYVTVMCEPARGARGRCPAQTTRVLAVSEGKDAQAVQAACESLVERGLKPEAIVQVCADMSPAYAKGVKTSFPFAELVFDFFHVVQLITAGVDQVRRRESRQFPQLLKGTRYLWLKNDAKLTQAQRQTLQELARSKLQTAKAHTHLVAFQDLLRGRDYEEALGGLKWWYNWVTHSRVPEMIKVAKSIKRHWDGILAYLRTRLTNGPAEAINGIIQTAKRKSRGFRSFEYFRITIHLIASKLTFDLPSPIPVDPHKTS